MIIVAMWTAKFQGLTMILDVTVGARKIYCGWDKKLNDPLVGIDVRKGDFSYNCSDDWVDHEVLVEPTIQADLKHLPFQSNIFEGVVFDPPHTNASLDTWIGRYYGAWTQREAIQTVRHANKEFARVLRPRGFLILKVMPRQFPLYETLLKNFRFFLPIATYRARGSYAKDFGKRKGALWAIGQLNKIPGAEGTED